jgi:hypothetical protein
MYLRLAITTQQQLKAQIILTRGLHIAIDCSLCYNGSADDFGPMNFMCIHQFCSLVDEQASKQDHSTYYYRSSVAQQQAQGHS